MPKKLADSRKSTTSNVTPNCNGGTLKSPEGEGFGLLPVVPTKNCLENLGKIAALPAPPLDSVEEGEIKI